MKGSNYFKNVIQDFLNSQAEKDELFEKTLKKENKNIDDCITYILNQVKESGCNGFADEEVFQMAMHYYDEDDLTVGKAINANIVVNHSIDKPKSRVEKIELANEKVTASKNKVIKLEASNQVSLFDFEGV